MVGRFLSPDTLDPLIPGVGTNRDDCSSNDPIDKRDPVDEQLVASGAIKRQTLERAQRAAEESGSRVDQALNRLGLVVQTWSGVTGIPSVVAADLPTAPPGTDTLLPAFLPTPAARPSPSRTTSSTLAIEDPLDSFTPAAVAARTGFAVALRLVRAGDLNAWLKGLPDDTLQAAIPAAALVGSRMVGGR